MSTSAAFLRTASGERKCDSEHVTVERLYQIGCYTFGVLNIFSFFATDVFLVTDYMRLLGHIFISFDIKLGSAIALATSPWYHFGSK